MDTLAVKALLSLLVIAVVKATTIPQVGHLPSRSAVPTNLPLGGRPYYIAYACERTILTLRCSEQHQKIQLVHATYGRQNMRRCNNGEHRDVGLWRHNCVADVRRTTGVVANMCNGRETCIVPVVNILFSDPCPTTFKYLEIYYTCIAP